MAETPPDTADESVKSATNVRVLRRPAAPAGAPDRMGARAACHIRYLDSLKPLVLAEIDPTDPALSSRRKLAFAIGEIVARELGSVDHSLSLLEQRDLITDLIDWLPRAARGQAGPGSADGPEADGAPGQEGEEATEASRTQVEDAKRTIHGIVMERIDMSAAARLEREELSPQLREIVGEALVEERVSLNQREQDAVADLLLDEMLGLGPLEPLLANDSITDIMVNGPGQVYVERGGKLAVTDVRFRDDAHVLNVARRIVSLIGRRIDESSPLVDARLKDGSRVNIIIPPLAIDGPSISIRKFAKHRITLDVMTRQQNLSPAIARVLKIASRSRLNILISGGTGSGKTTLLNALSQMIDPGERIVTIEDAAELRLQQPHVVRLETRPANLDGQGEISMRDLVKNALRMRPDRIILGEVRGSEAIDMLQAMNTGHDGSLGTIHANRPREALVRLENMIALAGVNLPSRATRTQIASAIDMIVQISRMRDGTRRITNVTEVVGMEGDVVTMQDLFTFEFEGEGQDGQILGQFKAAGLRPHFTPKAAYFGLDRPLLEVM